MSEKKHYYYFDYMRLFAMLSVVFMHCAANALRVNTAHMGCNWHLINAITSLAFCAVPLFFMMSGYLLLSSPKTTDVSYLMKKRLPKLVVPLIVYTAIAVIHNLYRQGGLGVAQFLDAFAVAGSKPVLVHFWFMYTLVAMYLISPILYGGVNSLGDSGKKYLVLLVAVSLLLVTVHAVMPSWGKAYTPHKIFSELAFFGGHIFPFLLGWVLGNMKRKVPNIVLVAIAVLDLAFIVVMTVRRTIQNDSYTQIFQSQSLGFEILLAACIFIFCKQNLNRMCGCVKKIVLPLTSLSFPIYLLHNIVLTVWNSELGGKLYPDTVFGTILLTLIVTAICFITIKTLATIKPLCFMFTGMSYKAACNSCNWCYTAKNVKEIFSKSGKGTEKKTREG